jgi:NADH-quinone oxidoreductase subunit G
VPNGPAAVTRLADRTGARLAWVPRRAGERGALDAGALAGLLPGGRPLTDAAARSQVAQVWGIGADDLPREPGLAGNALLRELAAGAIGALVVGGIDTGDYGDVALAQRAIEGAGFVVCLEQRHSSVTEAADVVLPIAAAAEKAGTFVDWEGRHRPFPQVLREALSMSDASVLTLVADAMDVASGPGDLGALRRELAAIGPWNGPRPQVQPADAPPAQSGTVLASWRVLLDAGTLQEGDAHLAATARPVVAKLGARLAGELGNPLTVTLTGPAGSIVLPAEIGEVVDGAVWVPMRSPGCMIGRDLGLQPGDRVEIRAGGSL